MRHEFALYSPTVSLACHNAHIGQVITLSDEQVWHRLKHVIRSAPGALFCLFDRTTIAKVTFIAFGPKHQVLCNLDAFVAPRTFYPEITVLLPLLKREAFADALYSCVELGAHHVQLVITEKSQQAWMGASDRNRCEKIMIAAAEQSKQFMFPTLFDPLLLPRAVAALPPSSFRIQCDPQGIPLVSVIEQACTQNKETLIMTFGPEGDFTDHERTLLHAHQFVACALTPTVLRASQALVIALGTFRSIFAKKS